MCQPLQQNIQTTKYTLQNHPDCCVDIENLENSAKHNINNYVCK